MSATGSSDTSPGAELSGRSQRLTAADAVLWDLDRDPVLRTTITAIAVLDRPPDWDRLRARMERVTRLVPKLRRRVQPARFGIGPPRWVEDGELDLDAHLRRVRAPEPGTFGQVLELVQPIATSAFDPARPLWEFVLIEGLQDGGAVLVQKMHHSITDGVGGVELALLVLDAEPDPGGPEPVEGPQRADPPARAPFDRWVGALGMPFAATGRLVATAATAARSPVGAARSAAELVDDVHRLLAPAPAPTALTAGRGDQRRFHTLDVPLRALGDAGRRAGGTINDAFVAAVVDGLRRYHELHGVELDQLSVTMPVSSRQMGDDAGGNHFTPARFRLPAAAMHPIDRIRAVGRVAHHWQRSQALALTDSISAVLELLPPAAVTFVMGSMLAGIDVVVTNVPGPPAGCYLAGAEVLAEYAMAPTSGAAVNVALVSVGPTACIGVAVDVAAVPDDQVLMDCLVEGFRSIESLGSGPERDEPGSGDYIQ